jgi:hypothetical protein
VFRGVAGNFRQEDEQRLSCPCEETGEQMNIKNNNVPTTGWIAVSLSTRFVGMFKAALWVAFWRNITDVKAKQHVYFLFHKEKYSLIFTLPYFTEFPYMMHIISWNTQWRKILQKTEGEVIN